MSEHATRTIIYTVAGQHISHDYAAPDAVNESRRYLQAMFRLDETWNGLRIEAIFYNRSVTAEPVPLDESLVCEVPAVVLRKPEREFYCGIVGYGEDGYRLTSDAVGVDLGGAAYTQGRTPAQPEPDLYARILAGLADKLDANQGAENAGKALVIGADGSVVPGEVQGGGGDHPLYLCRLSTTSPFTLDRTYAEVAAASAAGYAVAAMWGKYIFTLRTLSETAAQFACVDLEFRGYGVTLLTFNLPADSQEVGNIYAKVPFAGSTTGGVVCAEPATEADTIPARLGEDGRLYVAASPAPVTSVNGQTGDVKLGMVVTITDNGDGTLAASHIASEIIAHVEAGGTAVAEYNGYTMRYYGADEGAAVFIVDMIITSRVQREMLGVTEDGVAIYFKDIYTPPTPPTMTGATADVAGASGVVPAPAAGDEGKFLRGDGTWGEESENWRVIAEGAITENVESIEITEDLLGNPLKLKKAKAYAILYSSENKGKWISFASDSSVQNAHVGTNTSTYVDKCSLLFASCIIDEAKQLHCIGAYANNTNIYGSTTLEAAVMMTSADFVSSNKNLGISGLLYRENTAITKITLSAKLKAGSAYKIWGVDE